ncbi:hypothetical protein [Herbiconiux daphne]|uniref:RES domain-containing protein n=1 Tax=Herbiconiux daphne TaxID=2970914 RepID=A0ABT2GZW9_9MICO|nr:hypothetical protein [Herbiconiux daphne]MCS5732311.1 hypothetical protein [Herbiconiux daphne]
MELAALRSLNDQARSGRVRLFHGGFPGLQEGAFILPPAESGSSSMRGDSERAGFRRITTAAELVYVTTERSLAAAAAAYWAKREPGKGRGWLYRVELDDDDLVPDDDLPRGPFISFQLPRARIAAVLDRGVDPDAPRHLRELQRFVALIG